MKMYCFYNKETKKFSNSWDEAHHKKYFTGMTQTKNLKLIEYTCLNDPSFTINDDVSKKDVFEVKLFN